MSTIHKTIKLSGGRLTKTKKAIIDILSTNHCFLTKEDLVKKLNSRQIKPDRSTIYRELQFLTKNNLVIKNNIVGVDYFEIPQSHHHHLVCLKCNNIKKIEISNHLEKQEKQIAEKNKFNIVSHSLEFFGYCYNCQN